MEIRHLMHGMHAGVGTSRPAHGCGSARQLMQRTFQTRLDGGSFGLPLPAIKFGSIISQNYSNVAHDTGILPSDH
jgi:hypothetical protein